jgi:hypothetical protein
MTKISTKNAAKAAAIASRELPTPARTMRPKFKAATPQATGSVRQTKSVSPSNKTPNSTVRGGSKLDALVQQLQTKRGVTIDHLAKATGWQTHSVRGAISGSLKKKLGLKIVNERVDGVRRYRIVK